MFKGWDIFVAESPVLPESHPLYFTSPWTASCNVLLLDEKRVVCEASEEPTIRKFEEWGFDVVKVRVARGVQTRPPCEHEHSIKYNTNSSSAEYSSATSYRLHTGTPVGKQAFVRAMRNHVGGNNVFRTMVNYTGSRIAQLFMCSRICVRYGGGFSAVLEK